MKNSLVFTLQVGEVHTKVLIFCDVTNFNLIILILHTIRCGGVLGFISSFQ